MVPQMEAEANPSRAEADAHTTCTRPLEGRSFSGEGPSAVHDEPERMRVAKPES
jgi:hypothetical protein